MGQGTISINLIVWQQETSMATLAIIIIGIVIQYYLWHPILQLVFEWLDPVRSDLSSNNIM